MPKKYGFSEAEIPSPNQRHIYLQHFNFDNILLLTKFTEVRCKI